MYPYSVWIITASMWGRKTQVFERKSAFCRDLWPFQDLLVPPLPIWCLRRTQGLASSSSLQQTHNVLVVQALGLLISFAHKLALQSRWVLPTPLSTSISYSTQPTALLGLKSNDNFTWLRILKFGLHSCHGNYKWNILFILFPSYMYIFILLGMFLLACFPNV